jgi:hypothetical protein
MGGGGGERERELDEMMEHLRTEAVFARTHLRDLKRVSFD